MKWLKIRDVTVILFLCLVALLTARLTRAQEIRSPESNLLTTFESNRFVEQGKTIATIRGESVIDCSGTSIAIVRGRRLLTTDGTLMVSISGNEIRSPTGALLAKVDADSIDDSKGRVMFRSKNLDPMVAAIFLVGLNYGC